MTELDTTLPLSSESPSAAPHAPAWLETAALAALALTAGALVGGRDALVLRPELAWLALAPLLAGLRHGPRYGAACASAQAGALLAAVGWGAATVQVPMGQLALAWLVAGLLAGQFRDAWARRLVKAEAQAADLAERLAGLKRGYRTLRASHDRLQREDAGRARALRDAVGAFDRELGGGQAGALAPETFGGRVLALVRGCAPVRAASFHLLDGRGEVGPALAALGDASSADRFEGDPVVREAARVGEVVSAREEDEGRGALAAIPLVDPAGRPRAVVALWDVPSPALRADALAALGVIGACAGAALARAGRPGRAPC